VKSKLLGPKPHDMAEGVHLYLYGIVTFLII